MPYINPERRPVFDEDIDKILLHLQSLGELNYCMTRLSDGYLRLNTDRSYDARAGVEGVISHVSKELYRRDTVPYEDLKLSVNGDVYGGPK